jgi:hypothetical protein
VQVNIAGSYNPGNRQGEAVVLMLNSSGAPIGASAFVVITEDSINYNGPNGDPWHNHVCRDYVPDQNGTAVAIPAGGSDTLTMPFVLDPAWNEARCNVLVYLQGALQPDSTRPTYNAGLVPVLSMTGVQEPALVPGRPVALSAAPNPCRENVRFSFNLAGGADYRFELYAPDGRLLEARNGRAGVGASSLAIVAPGRPGVYLARLTARGLSAETKLVRSE